MLRQAAADLSLDLERSVVIGDRWLDVALAEAVGATGLLVRTGYGAAQEAEPMDGVQAAAIADNLMEAVSWTLRHPA
jgi:D-glycero-D-manno-heptose 1,7-bisphosphate phosphatase